MEKYLQEFDEIQNTKIRAVKHDDCNPNIVFLTVHTNHSKPQIIMADETCIADNIYEQGIDSLYNKSLHLIINKATKQLQTVFLADTLEKLYEHDEERLAITQEIANTLFTAEHRFDDMQIQFLQKLEEDPYMAARYEHKLLKIPHRICRMIGLTIHEAPYKIEEINQIEYAYALFKAMLSKIIIDDFISPDDEKILDTFYDRYLDKAKNVSIYDGLYTRDIFFAHTKMLMNY